MRIQSSDHVTDKPFDVVTGAFGYIGQYITTRLLQSGHTVRTLTGHPRRPHPFGDQVEAVPFDFDRPARLAESLRGASTVYNTYWIRFPHGRLKFERAVENTKILVGAARAADVRRFVHISITNPSVDSTLGYFRGKAILEQVIADAGLSYAIVRPTVVFGREDVLINNIAWLLRRSPVFLIPGSGDYRLQPVFVEDLADLAIEAGERGDDVILDAVGPEMFTFEELVRGIANAVGSRARLLRLPTSVVVPVANTIGWFLGDVLLTRDEARGLIGELLISDKPPTGRTRFSDWIAANAEKLGTRYASELARHYR